MSDVSLLNTLRGLPCVDFCALKEEEEEPSSFAADQLLAQEGPVPHPQHHAQVQTSFQGSHAPELEGVGGNENVGTQSELTSASVGDTSSISMVGEDGNESATCSTPHFSHLSSAADDSRSESTTACGGASDQGDRASSSLSPVQSGSTALCPLLPQMAGQPYLRATMAGVLGEDNPDNQSQDDLLSVSHDETLCPGPSSCTGSRAGAIISLD